VAFFLELLLVLIIGRAFYRRLSRRLTELEERTQDGVEHFRRDRLDRLQQRVAALERVAGIGAERATRTVTGPPDAEEAAAAIASDPLLRPTPVRREAPPTVAAAPPAVTEHRESPSQQRWRRIERQLVGNWTGILGTVVVLVGITFIGAYAGLQLSPLFRSVLIAGAAGVLTGASYVLGRTARWEPLALWLKSGGAAVFLFATFAASAIPGLSWIASLGPALGVLLLGLAGVLSGRPRSISWW